jgi:heme exporter protein CcmD
MSALAHFFDMGGYAAYVWPSYGIAFLLLGLNVWWAHRALAQARHAARRRIAMRGEDR